MSRTQPENGGSSPSSISNKFASFTVSQSRLVIAALLVFSLLLGLGVLQLETDAGFLEVEDLPEKEAHDYLTSNFTEESERESILLVVEDEEALSQESARRQIAFQQRIIENTTVPDNPRSPPIGFGNAVASLLAYQIDSSEGNVSEADLAHRREMLENGNLTYGPENHTHPPLARQETILQKISEDTYSSARHTVIGAGGEAFLPSYYDNGSTNATILVIPVQNASLNPEAHVAAQEIANDELDGETRAFSPALHSIEMNRAIQDSLLLIGPLSFLFVFGVLLVTFRSLADVLLGFLGTGLVLLWMFGAMGWAGIAFNQLFIAAPMLVVGLSVDYMFHGFMRYREHVESAKGSDLNPAYLRNAMRATLSGVGVALAIITGTTALGFLANISSPVPTIREFGVLAAISIISIFIVFGILLPLIRLQLDTYHADRDSVEIQSALGTGGRLGEFLAIPARFAWNRPGIIIAGAILSGATAAYAATFISPSLFTTFLPRNPSPWLYTLPEPFAPGSYEFLQTADYLGAHFSQTDQQAQILLRGDVTSAAVLERLARGTGTVRESNIVVNGSSGGRGVESPLTVMQAVARENASFNETLQASDTNGDGIPDNDIREVYDELYRVAPDRAAGVIHREDGEYHALLVTYRIRGDVDDDRQVAIIDRAAAEMDTEGLDAVPASQSSVFAAGSEVILDGIVKSLAIALFVVSLFVVLLFGFRHGSVALGVLTALPVGLTISWLFGTMYLLDVPFNEGTGLIASFTIALGIDYTIHVTERFQTELALASPETALVETLRGTGGALFGSALTTGGGFAILLLAVFPPLQLFGYMMALTMLYSFLVSIVVLPSLLAIWCKYWT